jgi:hypothetical protein
VTLRPRFIVGGSAGVILAVASAGAALGAVQVVEVSAQRVLPGTVMTMSVATTSSVLAASDRIFMIPSGTWGDSPDDLLCEQVGRAIEVGQIVWQTGTVQYQGATYEGFEGHSTFVVPDVPEDTYRLAQTIHTRGTGCHVYTAIEVVAELPDTALEAAVHYKAHVYPPYEPPFYDVAVPVVLGVMLGTAALVLVYRGMTGIVTRVRRRLDD